MALFKGTLQDSLSFQVTIYQLLVMVTPLNSNLNYVLTTWVCFSFVWLVIF